MKRHLILLLLVCGIALAGSPAVLADRDEIEEILDRYITAYNHGDAAALAGLYAEDALILPQDEPGARGKAKIERFWKRTLRFAPARRMGRAASTLLLAKKAGADVAYLVGTFGIGGADTHNFTMCLVRDWEGKWLIASEMWNSQGPRMQPVMSTARPHRVWGGG